MPRHKQSPTPQATTHPLRRAALVVAVAIGLTVLFWEPLWNGGGFIGGDLYPYFFPQKSFLADRLEAGEFPLWNNLTGHGYPLIAESQTAALYPPNLVLYRLLDVNTAYSVSHIFHYVLAFTFTWMYARKLQLSVIGSLFAALVYTYGWFPSRACLEWAIIGGTYLPLSLWGVEGFLQSRRVRYLLILSVALGLQMLAGHYNLAFITQLVLAAYIPLRLWFATTLDSVNRELEHRGAPPSKPMSGNPWALRLVAPLIIAIVGGFGLAAVQLVPTWELKTQSQRADVGATHNPAYGHLPPLYWTQVVAPWWWYTQPDLDARLGAIHWPEVGADTNKVEAHLYFGQVALLLLLVGVIAQFTGRPVFGRIDVAWLLIGVAALLYTPGWTLPVTKHLPGFSFFMGPGRYGIVTTLAAALLSARALDYFQSHLGHWSGGRWVLVVCVFAVSIADFWWVSRAVTYAIMLDQPPIEIRKESEVASVLRRYPGVVRMYAPGANLPQLTGFAATPVYLGLGPAAYFDPERKIPEAPGESGSERFKTATPEKIDWLRRAGVTHILSQEPLDESAWPVRLVWSGFDRLLNTAWAQFDRPLSLYELDGTRGRISWVAPHAESSAAITNIAANQIDADVSSPDGGRVILTDLAYTGWEAAIDGAPAETIIVDGMYRGVDVPAGRHEIVWKYRPRSVYWGGAISVGTALLLIVFGFFIMVQRRRNAESH